MPTLRAPASATNAHSRRLQSPDEPLHRRHSRDQVVLCRSPIHAAQHEHQDGQRHERNDDWREGLWIKLPCRGCPCETHLYLESAVAASAATAEAYWVVRQGCRTACEAVLSSCHALLLNLQPGSAAR